MAAGNRLLDAQALELKLMAEKESRRPGLLKEIRTAGERVNALASEYLETIRRCRHASADDTSSNGRPRNLGTSAFLAAFQRPWQRRKSLPIDRLEQLCLH